ncbi:MFS transporter [Candidatus Poribacteria bacterium]|nr:MFS transporter [Candidatus Poribacteria bacterium]
MQFKFTHLIIIYFPALFIDYAFGSVLSNSSFYSSYLNFSSSFFGLLVAVATLCYTLLAIPMGKFSDRIDRRKMLYAGCLLLAVVGLLLPYCSKKIHLLLIFPCIGISMSLFWPAYEAWLAEREGEGKLIHRVMLFNLFWSTGLTLGPAFSGYLYQDTNPFRPFYLSSLFGIITIGVITICKPKQPTENIVENDNSSQTLFPSAKTRNSYLNIARCANFASYFTLGVLRWLAPKLTKEMGIPPSMFGNMMLALGGIQPIAFLFLGTGYSTRWHYRLNPLIVVQILSIISLIVIGIIQNNIIWICAFIIIGISVAFTYFSSLYYGLDRHEDMGNKSGWHEAILGLGSLLGPLLGGFVSDSKYGTQSPYILCAGVICISIVVEILLKPKNQDV